MDPFWNEITEHFHSALLKAETLGTHDLKTLSEIPEIQTYLKQLDVQAIDRLIDHAKQIRQRDVFESKILTSDGLSVNSKMKDADRKMLNKVQAGLTLALQPKTSEANSEAAPIQKHA